MSDFGDTDAETRRSARKSTLDSLVSTLSSDAMARITHAYNTGRGERSWATDEVLCWALEKVVGVSRPTLAGKSAYVYINSVSLAADVRRYALTKQAFEPSELFMRNSSMYALREALGGQTLELDATTELVFLPLHSEESMHWSLLVLDVPRRQAVHFDSLEGTHSNLARRTLGALIAGGVIARLTWTLSRAKCTQQSDAWSCGYFVLVFAHTCKIGGVDVAGSMDVDRKRLRDMIAAVMAVARSRASLVDYNQRLANYFGSLIATPAN